MKSLTVCVSLRGRCPSREVNRDFCVLRYRKTDFSCWKITLWFQLEFSPQLVWLLSVSALKRRWKPSSNSAASSIPQHENMSLWQAETRTGARGPERAAQSVQRVSSGGHMKRCWWVRQGWTAAGVLPRDNFRALVPACPPFVLNFSHSCV